MSEKKKQKILDAASECFAKFGYKKTTLDDIGEKIGLNKASLYYYFKNKEEIFTTIVINEVEKYIKEVHSSAEENVECEEQLFNYFVQRLSFLNDSIVVQQITEIEPEKLQLLIESGQSVLMKLYLEDKAFLSKLLNKCIENGRIQDCDVEKVGTYLFGLVDGIKHNAKGFFSTKKFSQSEYESVLQDIRAALKIFINGLK